MAHVAGVAEGTRAGVPSEVVEFVARGRQLAPAHDLAEGRRRRVTVDDRDGVLRPARRIEGGHVGQRLRWRSHGIAWAAIEGRIRRLAHGTLLAGPASL